MLSSVSSECLKFLLILPPPTIGIFVMFDKLCAHILMDICGSRGGEPRSGSGFDYVKGLLSTQALCDRLNQWWGCNSVGLLTSQNWHRNKRLGFGYHSYTQTLLRSPAASWGPCRCMRRGPYSLVIVSICDSVFHGCYQMLKSYTRSGKQVFSNLRATRMTRVSMLEGAGVRSIQVSTLQLRFQSQPLAAKILLNLAALLNVYAYPASPFKNTNICSYHINRLLHCYSLNRILCGQNNRTWRTLGNMWISMCSQEHGN